jgi:HTH-type transcriptional regulator/antitoxin HipB
MRHRLKLIYDTAEFGDSVRRVRNDQGLTQAELAERLGVTRMTVSRLERGDSVSLETALRALSECGYALAAAPKFSRLRLDNGPEPSSSRQPQFTRRPSPAELNLD